MAIQQNPFFIILKKYINLIYFEHHFNENVIYLKTLDKFINPFIVSPS